MKKNCAVFLICLLLLGTWSASLWGCKPSHKTDGLSVVATIFPEYDWVSEVLGDTASDASLTLLLDNGVDLHNYQPTAKDLITIASCDLFIYIGGESDAWVEKALAQKTNPNRIEINLMEVLKDYLKEEEAVEGMESEEEEEGETEYDEHLWLSLKNAAVAVGAISDALSTLNPENASLFADNASAYTSKLKALDQDFSTAIQTASRHTVLFGDRFPFRYLTDDYGLNYFAAFKGCSAESEASFETVAFLAGKVDELRLPYVFCLEGSSQKIAQTIIDTASEKGVTILTLNSMQSVTAADVAAGVHYLDIMKQNLEVLKKALQ